MPKQDGSSLRDAVRARPALHGTPVLLATGEAARRQPGRSPVLLVKPFNGRLLRRYVRTLAADGGEPSRSVSV